jgi:hypothetical protein
MRVGQWCVLSQVRDDLFVHWHGHGHAPLAGSVDLFAQDVLVEIVSGATLREDAGSF